MAQPRCRLSLAQARRIALAAQGFTDAAADGSRSTAATCAACSTGSELIQIDSVNVLVRSQELPLFARLGPHPRTLIADATDDGELFEYWVHEACHVPTDDYHLYRWTMRKPHRWPSGRSPRGRPPRLIEEVYEHVADDGPLVRRRPPAAGRPEGHVVGLGRRQDRARGAVPRREAHRSPAAHDFARVYDLTERVIRRGVLARPTRRSARPARSCSCSPPGITASARSRTSPTTTGRKPPCRPLIAELVEEGRLIEATVEGWTQPAYLHPDAIVPRRVTARALLSPFDPVVWYRDRAERLFGFHYRIEIYVPPPKRQYGYYVLPFLLGDELVGRVDLKADRAAGTLLVQSAWGEPGIDEPDVAEELPAELRVMAGWLELEPSSSSAAATSVRLCDGRAGRRQRPAQGPGDRLAGGADGDGLGDREVRAAAAGRAPSAASSATAAAASTPYAGRAASGIGGCTSR